MGFWDTFKRGALAVGTGGLSELARQDDVQNFLDPGREDRQNAEQLDEEARRLWTGDYQVDPVAEGTGLYGYIPTTEDQQLEYGYGPDQISGYQVLNPLEGNSVEYVDPGQSAYSKLGPSAFEGVDVDERARSQLEDASRYFSDLSESGTDPQAEADYARRVAEAERMRDANTEAALRALELKGQGGAGEELLAELSGTQASANDQYQAGLDAAALASARRDAAATQVGDLGGRLGALELQADTSRAGGTDTFNQNKAGAQDAWDQWDWSNYYGTQQYNADREYDANQQNWNRANQVSDANTDTRNNVNYWNKVGAPQQYFQNVQGVTAGASGQYGASASGLRDDAQNRFSWPSFIGTTASNVARARAGGG